jgi:acetylornithine deacetylase
MQPHADRARGPGSGTSSETLTGKWRITDSARALLNDDRAMSGGDRNGAATGAEALLRELVALDSVNPGLAPGAAGEAEIAGYVAGRLEAAGLDVEVEEVLPGRPNVVARAGGRGSGRRLLLVGHLDTVGYEGMVDPLRPRVEGGRLYGRGACDMKSGLAAIMLAGAHAAKAALQGEVIVAAVVDEEVASAGSESLAGRIAADAAIVAEPTDLAVCTCHRGFVWCELETTGRAAHGSRYDLGVDAIAAMGPALSGLERLDAALRSRAPHPLLGVASVHASTIDGGREWAIYPDRCRLRVERRTLPGEPAADVAAELAGLLPPDGSVTVVLERPPLETPADEPVVRSLLDASGRTGVVGLPFWTDAALYAAAGVPSVVFGPGGGGIHELVEWADLDQLAAATSALCAVVDSFCA